jgi:uncharacterized protein (TIGR02453 family)
MQLHSDTFSYLKDLKKNNNKEWFEKNRKRYDVVRNNFFEVAQKIIDGTLKFDASIGDQSAKNCVYRINRDVRFSKDKSPYKSNFAAVFSRGGRKSHFAGYYFHLEPGDIFVGGGVWMPEAANLQKVRQEIDYNLKEFIKITTKKSFQKTFGNMSGERLSRPPKGYEADNPAIEYLKHKSFLFGARLKDSDLKKKDADKSVVSIFRELSPFIYFLNRALE